MTALYKLHQIVQCYGKRTVLAIEALEIEAACIHALLGPNGAGKTTLLKLLGFQEIPQSGRLIFQGEPVSCTPAAMHNVRQKVVLLEQHPIMFSTTVAANIEFGLKIRKIDPKKRAQKIDEVLELVGLSRYRKESATHLSGGETQRLALARALAVSPQVLLCDEPTASVDAKNQVLITALLREINTRQGVSIIFTTHDRLQATDLADHSIVLDEGRLVPSTRV